MSKWGQCKIENCTNNATGRAHRCELHMFTMFAEVVEKVMGLTL